MPRLPLFIAKLIGRNGCEDKRYFETQQAAVKWVLKGGSNKIQSEVASAEVHKAGKGLVWAKGRSEPELIREFDSLAAPLHDVRPSDRKPVPDVAAYCEACKHRTMHWRESKTWLGLKIRPVLRCSGCFKATPENASPQPGEE